MKNSSQIFVLLIGLHTLGGCAAFAVADAAVGTTVFLGKTAVKGTVGAGKLVYKGGKAVAGIGGGGSNDVAYSGGPQTQSGPSCLNADGSYSDASIDANGSYYCAN